jgi:hypothetical protein
VVVLIIRDVLGIVMRRRLSFAVLAAALALGGAAQAEQRVYAYDPADQATQRRLESGLTVFFDRGLVGMRVREILATRARAAVKVDPAGERELGARLERLLPKGAQERELYAIEDAAEGPALVRALCPGSTRGWLVLSPLRYNTDLVIHALGDAPGGGPARHCVTLNLTFRGQWLTPPPGRGPTAGSYQQPGRPS